MTLKKTMELLETIYNSKTGEVTVQIGDKDGRARPINGIEFDREENIVTIH